MRASACALIVALCVGAGGAGAADQQIDRPRERLPAPAVALPRLGGGEAQPLVRPGAPAAIHFWASWCLACRIEMPSLARFARRWGIRLVLVSVDRDPRAAGEALRDWNVRLPSRWDPDGRARRRYAVRALPTTYFVAADGRFCARAIGARNWKDPAISETIGRACRLRDATTAPVRARATRP